MSNDSKVQVKKALALVAQSGNELLMEALVASIENHRARTVGRDGLTVEFRSAGHYPLNDQGYGWYPYQRFRLNLCTGVVACDKVELRGDEEELGEIRLF